MAGQQIRKFAITQVHNEQKYRKKSFRKITFLDSLCIQSGPEEIAQSLMHRHIATVCSRIT